MRPTSKEPLYDADFFAWTQLQAKALRRFARSRPNVDLDVGHIAEEIADLGKERRDSLRSWMRGILEHLLLLKYSPAREPRRGWIAEIVNRRQEIADRVTPTLQRDLARRRLQLYAEARRNLVRKLERYGEAEVIGQLPERCPWTLDQILGDFWPS